MAEEMNTSGSVDAYIAEFPEDVQEILNAFRAFLKQEAKDAKEKISWGMPTLDYHGNLVHFAANKGHLGFYPGANGVAHFLDELAPYKHSKGAIQFPYHLPIPYELISRIVKFRIMENEELAASKKASKKR